DPESAKKRLPKMADHEVWQARGYAAEAAEIAKDDRTLTRLGREQYPNVIAASITNPRDALKNVDSSLDYGLVLESTRKMKGWAEGWLGVHTLLSALARLTREKKGNSRDARTEILQRLREFGDIRVAGDLRPYLSDFDPAIAKLAADIISEKSGAKTEPL